MEEIQRDRKYRGRVFDVFQVDVRLPNGNERAYDLVVHPGAVVILPIDQGEVLFVRQERLGAGGMVLELPAGVLNKGEQPDDSARRELREETGMNARSWRKTGEFYIAPGYCSEYQHIYLAEDLFDSPLDPDADEFIELVRVPVEEAYQMAYRGEIRDGKSLAAMLLAKPYLPG